MSSHASQRFRPAGRAAVCLLLSSICGLALSPTSALGGPSVLVVSIATAVSGGQATVGGRLSVAVTIENRGEVPRLLAVEKMLSIEARFTAGGVVMGGIRSAHERLTFEELEVLNPGASVRRDFTVPLRMKGECVVVARLANEVSRALKGQSLADCPDLWQGALETSVSVRVDESDPARPSAGEVDIGRSDDDLVARLSRLGAATWGLDASEASLARVIEASRHARTAAERRWAFSATCAAVSRAWGARSASFVLSVRRESLDPEDRLAQLGIAVRVRRGMVDWTERLGARLTARYAFAFEKETIAAADRVVDSALQDPDPTVREAARSAVR